MAPHSSTLAWKIPWMEAPGRLQSMGSLRVGDNWETSLSRIGEGNGNPLQCSCLENLRDRGAWWAAAYQVAQSRTRLKWLSSSSSSRREKSTLRQDKIKSRQSKKNLYTWNPLSVHLSIPLLCNVYLCYTLIRSPLEDTGKSTQQKQKQFPPETSRVTPLEIMLLSQPCSIQFSHSVVSDSLRSHESQHARPPCPLQTPRVYSNAMSIESVMPSSHLILCRPLLLLPPTPPSIRVFSNESTLLMRWPKYWSFSFSISPSNEHPGLICLRMDWLDLLAVQGTLKSLLQHHSSKASILWCPAFFIVHLSHPTW